MPAVPDRNQLNPTEYDVTLEPHVLTDKQQVKWVPCRECKRCCVVTTFIAPIKVICRSCKGESNEAKTTGTQAVVIPGKTIPEFARNLADVLINKQFAHVLCPFDPEHRMELKDVSHSPHYGPRHLLGYKDGIPQYEQETGETAMHQCLDCNVVVSMSTQHPRQFKRCNEPKTSARSGPSTYEVVLGLREEDKAQAA